MENNSFPITFTDILRDSFGIINPKEFDTSKSAQIQELQKMLLSTSNNEYK